MKKILSLTLTGLLCLSIISCGNIANSGSSSSTSSSTETTSSSSNWLSDSTPSLYQTYKDYFDYIGIAVEHGTYTGNYTELYYSEVQNGLAKHANSITMGNEFKPQFIFQWWNNDPTLTSTSFTASNGVTISQVPPLNFTTVDAILTICKNKGLKMRGHVLLWHSQTDEAFFREGFTSTGDLVDAPTMDARLEWYIKTVLNHVAEWESTNNSGNHIIWAWDVANECTSDSSTLTSANTDPSSDSAWLRTSGSNWYTIYKAAADAGTTNPYTGTSYTSYDYVINAFKFANKYAPSDVELCYNDYGGAYGYKHNSQLLLVKKILAHKNDSSTLLPTRLDAMGLQSHYSVTLSASSFENEIKDFIDLGINVQITELDIATKDNYSDSTDTVGTQYKAYDSLAAAYKAYFTMFLNNRKTSSTKGISCVTIWGIYDEATWLNSSSQIYWQGDVIQYPLLFKLDNQVSSKATEVKNSNGETLGTLQLFDDGDSFTIKPAFTSVIQAATEYAAANQSSTL